MPKVSPAVSSSKVSVTPKCLGITEAARYLGATPWFVRTLIWENRIPYLKCGKRLLLDVSDLDTFIRSQKM